MTFEEQKEIIIAALEKSKNIAELFENLIIISYEKGDKSNEKQH